MFKYLTTIILAALLLLPSVEIAYSQEEKKKEWTGSLPDDFKESEEWVKLLDELVKQEMYYGAMAVAYRILTYFEDVESKDKAYRSIIELIDKGYPFSVRRYFVTGDLTTGKEYKFSNNYNFYKGIVNFERGMKKWAESYFQLVDKENYPKYLFFEALNAYGKKDFPNAKKFIFRILRADLKVEDRSFVNKVVRTLARIYFEEKKYEKSVEIYRDYLFKVNPVEPADYMEAAWAHYHLGQYEKSLGILYNIASKSTTDRDHLEQYVLRALIYREKCMEEAVQRLADVFDFKYKKALEGVKQGKALRDFPILKDIFVLENQKFYESVFTLESLRKEITNISEMKIDTRELAAFFYATEVVKYEKLIEMDEDKASIRAARELLIMSESLKFLTYDVRREKYNPDKVFIEALEGKDKGLVQDLDENTFQIRWIQNGDYWRDERTKMQGILVDQCEKI